jgi:4-hydroxybenzoate polyprenyltransferase
MNLKAYAQLVRLPNVFTTITNILAAYILSTQSFNPLHLIVLIISSIGLYTSGMAWNDVFDIKYDIKHNPERPIPSKNISQKKATLFATIAMGLGIAFPFLISVYSGLIALALAAVIICYNTVLKKTHITAALGMGTCRGLNWILGMSTGDMSQLSYIWIAFIPFTYIAILTFIARFELKNKNIKKIVIYMLTGIPILDGIILASYGHFIMAALTAAVIIPILILKRRIYMT